MTPVSARNIEFVGHSDQNGRGDGVQVMVHKGHAFVGHMFSDGFTVTDVRDPRHPHPVNFIAAPPNSRAFHLQTHEDLLLTVNSPNIWVLQGYADPNDYFKASITETFTRRDKSFTAGLRVFDISKPAEPREISFMPVDGLGLHRLWYVGGRYAYASCHWQGFTDHVLAIIDMAEPTRPEVVGRWWLPGMPCGGRRNPELDRAALCAASRDRGRQSRLCRVARRRHDDPRCRRSDRAQAARASQLVPALRRRHPHAVAAARPQLGRVRRRG